MTTRRTTIKILLLDIETSPISGYFWSLWNVNINTNNIIDSSKVLCWAAKWLGDKKLMFDSTYASSESDMIKRIHSLLDEADAVVHWNGQKFDIPVLNKEFLLHGLPPPAPFKQIDLLRTSRRQFKFPSHKLDYVAKSLGLGQKVKHRGFELWVDCMANNSSAWKEMEKYNKQDVVLLEKVYHRMLPWIKNHPNVSACSGETACSTCGSHNVQKRGTYNTSTVSYQRYQCNDCHSWMKEVAYDRSRPKTVLQGI